ncbi:MAG: cytochrome c3 family protein [bacterium]
MSYDRIYQRKLSRYFLYTIIGILCIFPQVAAQGETPHREIQDTWYPPSECTPCHYGKEKKGRESLRSGYETVCLTCHEKNLPGSCRDIITPRVNYILKMQIKPLPLNLFEERISCVSCHRIHTKKVLLVPEYKEFVKSAYTVIPHKSGVFCFICHQKEPRSTSKELFLKEGGDSVVLCKSCHNNEKARADNHPVHIAPSKERGMVIPNIFPLNKEGKITCLTCHQLKCMGNDQKPYLLRGGPYLNRIEACLMCHLKKEHEKNNPHNQMTADGEIREESCLFCHSIETETEGRKNLNFKFKAPFRYYCIGCHPTKLDRHPFGANHNERYIESIWKGLSATMREQLSREQSFKISPISIDGRLMCTTCHNPHDVQPGPKLRIKDINLSCSQCHYKQYSTKFEQIRSRSNQLLLPFLTETEPESQDMKPSQEDRQPFGYRASLKFYCIGCHVNKDRKHPYGIDHNGKFISNFWKNLSFEKRTKLSQEETSQILPLTTAGQIACFTCHNPHDTKKGNKLRLKEMNLLCALCHPDRSSAIERFKAKELEKKDNL